MCAQTYIAFSGGGACTSGRTLDVTGTYITICICEASVRGCWILTDKFCSYMTSRKLKRTEREKNEQSS